MPLSVILTQLWIIFAQIGAGVLMAKRGLVNDQQSKLLSTLVMELFLPCTLLASTGIDTGAGTVRWLFLGALALEILYLASAVVCKILAKRHSMPPDDLPAFLGTTVLPNSAFVGIPLITAILGSEKGMVYAASGIIAYNVFFFLYVIGQFQKGDGRKPSIKENLKGLCTTTNLTTLIMVVMLAARLRFPAPIQSVFSAIGNCTTPVALMICGVTLSRGNFKELLTEKMLYMVTFLRNLAFPLAFVLVLWLLPLNRTMCFGVSILAACPSGSLAVVAAKQYGKGEKLASQTVAHTTIFMAVTTPVVLMIASKLFGFG